jgi:toxin ParE1/3/4
MRTWRLSEEAQFDIVNIGFYLDIYSFQAADRVVERLYQQFQMLTAFPKLGKRYHEYGRGCRRLIVDHYWVIYSIHPAEIVIERVVSGYRDIASLFEEDEE